MKWGKIRWRYLSIKPTSRLHLFTSIFTAAQDIEFGCRAKQLFATGQTDNNGKYISMHGEINHADEGIVLSKANYWNAQGGTGKRYMSPEAWINLHLSRQKNYPDTSLFSYVIAGEYNQGESISFKPPTDTVVKVRAFGNEANTLNWQVIVKTKDCYIGCNTDTLSKGVLTQKFNKFVTTSINLSY